VEGASLISLLVSVAALAVSAWALIYARQQALIERSRRHQELVPRYKASIEPVKGNSPPGLSTLWILDVTLLSSYPLTGLVVTLTNSEFRIFQAPELAPGELQPLDDITAEWNGPVRPGDTVWSTLELGYESDEDLPTLAIQARRDKDSWTTVVHPEKRMPPTRRGR
jgi:hypothetical protein